MSWRLVALVSGLALAAGQGAAVGQLALPEVHPGRPDAAFHFRAAPGHVLFVDFGYTSCPDVCPTILGDLRQALRGLGAEARRVDVAFVTVDPARDVPRVLAPYLASFVRDGHALRPRSRAELAPVQRAFGAASTVTRAADGTIEVTHSATSYLVDENGRIVAEWPFGTKPAAMTRDLRARLGLPVS